LRASSFAMCSSYDFLSDEAKGVPGSECRTRPRLVGCRQRLEKKNRHRQIFCPLRPIWALIIMRVQLYTTWYSKAHRKREWRVKYITNITPNWSPCGLCLRPAPLCVFYLTKGKGARGSPKIDQGCSIGCPIPIVAISTSRASEVGQSVILVGDIINPSFLTFQWLSKVLEPRLDSFPMPNGRISARFPHLECYLPSPDVSRVGLYKRQNLRPKNLPPFLSPFLDMK